MQWQLGRQIPHSNKRTITTGDVTAECSGSNKRVGVLRNMFTPEISFRGVKTLLNLTRYNQVLSLQFYPQTPKNPPRV